MSNAYINNILFGVSRHHVNSSYVQELLPYMLTETKLNQMQSDAGSLTYEDKFSTACTVAIRTPSRCAVVPRSSVLVHPETEEEHSNENIPQPVKKQVEIASLVEPKKNRYNHQRNSLFWAIYELEHPAEAFLGTKANAEVELRLKVVASLKSTPKRLKETNSKLTIEQTQALMGSMLVAKEDKLDFCVAYAVYYNKPIVVVYNKTYCVFSPMVDIELETEDVIVLYAVKSETSKQMIYTSEKNPTREMIRTLMETKIMGPLKSVSNYKISELDDIAAKLQIATKCKEDGGKEKRRKKEDVYNDIKVAIHSEQVPSYKPTVEN
jgi:hypothetical protein